MNRAGNVRIIPFAVSNKTGTASLILPDEESHVGRYSLHPGRGNETLEISCVTLAQLIRDEGLAELDLIKIDCQGAEYEILFAAGSDVLSQVRQIIVECEHFPDRPEWSQEVLGAFLRDHGFDVSNLGNLLYDVRSR